MELHNGRVVLVEGTRITYVGSETDLKIQKDVQQIDLKGIPILLLHPYNETSWNDQVLKESGVERAIGGTVHAKNSLLAGVTTMRDLGAVGAGYTDVYLKKTIEEGIVLGPRLLVGRSGHRDYGGLWPMMGSMFL